MTKKIITSLLIAASMVSIGSVSANAAEWNKDSNNNYNYIENGSKVIGWKYIGNTWYNFDDSGVMRTGWYEVNGKWYYSWSDGAMAHDSWLDNGNMWYYFDTDGHMITDYKVIGNRKYDFTTPKMIFSREVNAANPTFNISYARTTSAAAER